MKDSKKQSNISNNDLPEDPCDVCLVTACCQDPCELLESYMRKVYALVESDPRHPILGRFPESLVDGMRTYINTKNRLKTKGKK